MLNMDIKEIIRTRKSAVVIKNIIFSSGREVYCYEYGQPSSMKSIYNLRESYDEINKQADDDPCC